MKKIASGDGWFDLQMSAEERDGLLHGLKFCLKHYDNLDTLEVSPPEFLKGAIRVFTEKTKPAESDYVSRFDMNDYMTVLTSLRSLLATIDAKQIDITKLDPKLDVKRLHVSKQALSDAVPSDERDWLLYPKEMQQYVRELMGRKYGKTP